MTLGAYTTERVTLGAAAALVGYDVIAAAVGGYRATITASVRDASESFLPWALGVVLAHLVTRWPWERPEWAPLCLLPLAAALLLVDARIEWQPPPELCAVVGVLCGWILWGRSVAP